MKWKNNKSLKYTGRQNIKEKDKRNKYASDAPPHTHTLPNLNILLLKIHCKAWVTVRDNETQVIVQRNLKAVTEKLNR